MTQLETHSSVDVMGMELARLTSADLLEHVTEQLSRGSGGWVVTANLDILLRHSTDAAARQTYARATLRVADGMPLVWASRIQREHLPERIAGSTFLYSIVERCAARGWGVYLLGGAPQTAEAAAEVLRNRYPGLVIGARSDLTFSRTPTQAELAEATAALQTLDCRVVLVGLGSPKQEFLIERLRERFPRTWWIGVGGSFGFVAGLVARAPTWAQRVGLEWAHRLAQEPSRLGRRYLLENLPFFGRLLVSSLRKRFS